VALIELQLLLTTNHLDLFLIFFFCFFCFSLIEIPHLAETAATTNTTHRSLHNLLFFLDPGGFLLGDLVILGLLLLLKGRLLYFLAGQGLIRGSAEACAALMLFLGLVWLWWHEEATVATSSIITTRRLWLWMLAWDDHNHFK